MKPYFERERLTLFEGDCREVMAQMPASHFDAIVTDPPYELGFMGKGWDNAGVAYDIATWTEALRVLKPGAHLLAFGAPRNFHRMACAIEDAGFEVRDCLMYLFGSGFPKSLDVSKALDKAAGVERPDALHGGHMGMTGVGLDDEWSEGHRDLKAQVPAQVGMGQFTRGTPVTELAQQWQGFGTSLKPAYEPIVMARKPLTGTVASNVAAWGTGGLNIDACRIVAKDADGYAAKGASVVGPEYASALAQLMESGRASARNNTSSLGRWPANVLLDTEAAALLDAMSGDSASPPIGSMGGGSPVHDVFGEFAGVRHENGFGDHGGASRFFYTAKTSRAEREFGLDDLDAARRSDGRAKDIENPRLRTNERRNDHPTVKPVDLMRWLCRLVTPPGGLILDPFLGSGSTGMAALDEGFRFMGIDLEKHYLDIAQRRIARRHVIEPMPQRDEGQRVLL